MMKHEISPYEVYTPKEVQNILKISESTLKRLLKRNLIHANKVGGQYRILGKELLRVVSPRLEKKAAESYQTLKKKIVKRIHTW